MLTFAEVQRRFPHTCAGIVCAICTYENQKADRYTVPMKPFTFVHADCGLSHRAGDGCPRGPQTGVSA